MTLNSLSNESPILLALLGTLFTWLITACGSAVIFLKKDISRKILDSSLGFSAGIMVAASFFSLLLPSIEISKELGFPEWLPAVAGFLAGGFFLRLIDKFLPHLHLNTPIDKTEGVKTNFKKTTLLIIAITMHNFPEGLAVGVAFGSIVNGDYTQFIGAVSLTIGIGIQNFPEGMAISLPLRREGFSRFKSFWYGQLSAVVEPIGGVLGATMVLFFNQLLPFALSFAAGAMIFVVIEELIPESQGSGNSDLSTMGAIIGFALMMLLDVGLG